MDSEAVVRAYYDAIDAHDYDAFADVLAPGVVHRRPDRTIEGRETLVEFMRDGRPNDETTHELRRVLADGPGAMAEGRLLDADGTVLFEFADAFSLSDGRIEEIRTFTR